MAGCGAPAAIGRGGGGSARWRLEGWFPILPLHPLAPNPRLILCRLASETSLQGATRKAMIDDAQSEIGNATRLSRKTCDCCRGPGKAVGA